MRISWFFGIFTTLSFVIFINALSTARAESLPISWSAVTMNTDGSLIEELAGYLVRWGDSSQNYSQQAATGLDTNYTLVLPDDGRTYYITVAAVDTSGNESENSNEVTFTTGLTDQDNDGTPDILDGCVTDPTKIEPGQCGCGVPDTDSDNDGIADCIDSCPNDPDKTTPGVCGCNTPDSDSDGDGSPDCIDSCVNDPFKTSPGVCGCGILDTDSDNDGIPNCHDQCAGTHDSLDSDGDGVPDCQELCDNDPLKVAPGACGCGFADTDSDGDGTPDCLDQCDDDPNKIVAGICGCGTPDTVTSTGEPLTTPSECSHDEPELLFGVNDTASVQFIQSESVPTDINFLDGEITIQDDTVNRIVWANRVLRLPEYTGVIFGSRVTVIDETRVGAGLFLSLQDPSGDNEGSTRDFYALRLRGFNGNDIAPAHIGLDTQASSNCLNSFEFPFDASEPTQLYMILERRHGDNYQLELLAQQNGRSSVVSSCELETPLEVRGCGLWSMQAREGLHFEDITLSSFDAPILEASITQTNLNLVNSREASLFVSLQNKAGGRVLLDKNTQDSNLAVVITPKGSLIMKGSTLTAKRPGPATISLRYSSKEARPTETTIQVEVSKTP